MRFAYTGHKCLSGTSLMTSANGSSLGVMKYDPFGTTRSGLVPTDKLFTGQRYDDIPTSTGPTAGLYYYGARYYDPELGRFMSPDTIVPDPMNSQAYNRYSYCLNNPLKFVDPSGNIVTIAGEFTYSVLSNGGIMKKMHTSAVSSDARLLDEAWKMFKQTMPDVANEMLESDVEYHIGWALDPVGNSCVELFGDQFIFIDDDDKTKSTELLGAYIAHESFHALEGNQTNSIFEEVGAYKQEAVYRDTVNLRQNTITQECLTKVLDPGVNPNLSNELNDIQTKWRSQSSIQARMYSNLPPFAPQGFWGGITNITIMLGSFADYYFHYSEMPPCYIY